MGNYQLSRDELSRLVYSRLLISIPVLLVIFFLPAGTLAYWEAWGYMATLFVPMFLVLTYLLRNAPDLLERRLRTREKEGTQKLIIKLSYLYYLVVFLLPGFDRRFGWSDVPIIAVILGDLLVLLGYSLFILVLRENHYASRVVEVEQDQPVISSGPYAIVRHPMYLAVSLMYIASPLALGSYWAIIPSLLIIPLLVARILNEERVLSRELRGYKDYMQKTRYRLLPGVW